MKINKPFFRTNRELYPWLALYIKYRYFQLSWLSQPSPPCSQKYQCCFRPHYSRSLSLPSFFFRRCHICDRGFSKITNLRNHLFLHTGEHTLWAASARFNLRSVKSARAWRPRNRLLYIKGNSSSNTQWLLHVTKVHKKKCCYEFNSWSLLHSTSCQPHDIGCTQPKQSSCTPFCGPHIWAV